MAGLIAGLLFAIHPLNVEAVAWTSGRKDVLSTFWFLVALLIFILYRNRHLWRLYVASLVCFLLALLSKGVTLTLPVVLLLLDYRDRKLPLRQAVVEKLPFFALSVVFGIVGLFGKTQNVESSTTIEKALMAAKSTVFYLQKLVWPTGLAPVYPYNGTISIGTPAILIPLLIVLALAAIVAVASRRTREVPFAAAFFVATLAPTFIVCSKGAHLYFASDRYAYIPAIAMFYLVGLGIANFLEAFTRPMARRVMQAAVLLVTTAVLSILAFLAHQQSLVWYDSETLFLHNLAYYPDAELTRIWLGGLYLQSGRLDEAAEQFEAAIQERPELAAYIGLGEVAAKQNDITKALELYQKAIDINPKSGEPLTEIGLVLAGEKRYPEAEAMFEKAIESDPSYIASYNNLGAMYLAQHRWADADTQFRRAIAINPDFMDAWYNWGYLLTTEGDLSEAIACYERLLALDPDEVDARLRLAPLYLRMNHFDQAITTVRVAIQEKPDDPNVESVAFDTIKVVLNADPSNKPAAALLQDLEDKGILTHK